MRMCAQKQRSGNHQLEQRVTEHDATSRQCKLRFGHGPEPMGSAGGALWGGEDGSIQRRSCRRLQAPATVIANHSSGIVICASCSVRSGVSGVKQPPMRRIVISHSADGGRGADACGLRLCRRPLAAARIHARQGARAARARAAARRQAHAEGETGLGVHGGLAADRMFAFPSRAPTSADRAGPPASRPKWFR